jgi:predicted DCC family thiol-disulfide oxidoreductase YuxK
MNNPPEFTLLYDGNCPICQKEVAWLRSRNRLNALAFQDINADDFNPDVYDKTHAELMAEIHGVLADGSVIKGMPVFRACYQAVGLGWLLAPTGWPVLERGFDRLYSLFARHRIKLGGLFGGSRCASDQCQLKP